MRKFPKLFFIFTVSVVCTNCELKIKNGLKIQYYENGNVKSMKSYLNGNLEGECVWYYRTGRIDEKANYRAGKADGHDHYFYESGALKSHWFWKDDKRIGYVADYFDDSAEIIKTVLYFNKNEELVYKKEYDSSGCAPRHAWYNT